MVQVEGGKNTTWYGGVGGYLVWEERREGGGFVGLFDRSQTKWEWAKLFWAWVFKIKGGECGLCWLFWIWFNLGSV